MKSDFQAVFGLKLLDTDAIAEFIASKYQRAVKIVEVMVGSNPWIASAVKKRLPKTEVVVVDRYKDKIDHVEQICPGLKGIIDDIQNPRFEIYRGAALIYAIRPPEELLPHMYDLAERVGADVLVRPYSDVDGHFYYPSKNGWRLVSYKRSTFWLLEHQG